MPLALLVNPASAHGRCLKLLPRVEQELDARRIVFRVERTRGLRDAIERALHAAEAGEIPVVMSGDGLIGAVGGALAGSETPLGDRPRRDGATTWRASSASPTIPRARSPCSPPATRAGSTSARRTAGDSWGSPARIRRRSEPDRQRDDAAARQPRLRLRGTADAAGAWKPARFTVQFGAERLRFTGYSVSAANSRAYGGGMLLAPDADLSDGEFDIVAVGEVGKLRFLGNLPKVFKGTPRRGRRGRRLPRPASRAERRVGRSPSTPTASTSPICLRRCACCPER